MEHALPEGASLRDLGEHRLKDIAPARAPATAGGRGPPGRLPAAEDTGRQTRQPPGAAHLVRRPGAGDRRGQALLEQTRLLTLTGPGGTGKIPPPALRVAAELLPAFKDGAFFADLSSVTDPTLVPPVVARALAVPEAAGRSILEAVRERLRDKELPAGGRQLRAGGGGGAAAGGASPPRPG